MGGGTRTHSGTPLETRGLTRGIANTLEGAFRGPGGQALSLDQVLSSIASPLQRLAGQSQMGILGFSPGAVGIESALINALNPDLSVLGPAEARARAELPRGIAEQFGNLGARFSDNIANAVGSGLSRLEQDFAITRLGALQNAGTLAAQLMPALNQAAQIGQGGPLELLRLIMGFGAPGAPVIEQRQGFLGPLLGTAAGSFLGPFGAAVGGGAGEALADVLGF